MAYQNVGTPRFYVDIFSYLKAIGLVSSESDTFNIGLNPSDQKSKAIERVADSYDYYNWKLTRPITQEMIRNSTHNDSVIGFLGHNFSSSNLQPRLKLALYDGDNQQDWSYGTSGNYKEIINGDGTDAVPEYDGFTLYRTEYSINEFNRFTMRLGNNEQAVDVTAKLGSVFIGTYYDMPHSPDLSLKLSYDYDGIKTQQTKGGATLSNALYSKPADWGTLDTGQYADNPRTLGCWQLEHPTDSHITAPNYRTGRRVWNLSFSYLSDRDVFPANASNNQYYSDIYDNSQMQNVFGYHADDITASGQFNSNILTGTDFFSQVWNRTMGGHLPFIFQPNKDVKLADQFAICRFDMDSLKYDQVAHNTYNLKLKIREVW